MPTNDLPAGAGSDGDSDYDSIDDVARAGLPPPDAPGPAVVAALPAFEGYTLHEPIGSGGMATVYRATGPDGRVVALKVLTRDDPEAEHRFDREANLLRNSIASPYVVRAYERLASPRPALVLEYMNAGSLRDHLAVRRTDREIAELVRTVAHGVAALHRAGVIHRDLKPGNVLMAWVGRVLVPKVADLGLAGFSESDRHAQLTTDERILGTLAYMAREQAEGEAATRATDVYGVGTILYELLTDRPPFVSESKSELRSLVIDCPPVPPSQFRRGMSARLEQICQKCLAKDPAARYESIDGLIAVLDDYLAAEGRRRFGRAAFAGSLALNTAAALVLGFVVDWKSELTARDLGVKLNDAMGRGDSLVANLGRTKAELTTALEDRSATAHKAGMLEQALATMTGRSDKLADDLAATEKHLSKSEKDQIASHNKALAEIGELKRTVAEQKATIGTRDKSNFDLQGKWAEGVEKITALSVKLQAVTGERDTARAELGKANKELTRLKTLPATGRPPMDPDLPAGATILKYHTALVAAVHLASDGTTARSVDAGGNLALWDLKTNTATGFDLKVAPVHLAGFSADGKRLALAATQKVIVLDVGTQKVMATVPTDRVPYKRVALSADGSRLLIQLEQYPHDTRIWRIVSGAEAEEVDRATSGLTIADFSPDGALHLGSKEGVGLVRAAESGATTELPFGELSKKFLSWGRFHPAGRYVVTHSSDHVTRVWAEKKSTPEREFKSAEFGYLCGTFSADGKSFVQVGRGFGGPFEVWETSDPDPAKWVTTHGRLPNIDLGIQLDRSRYVVAVTGDGRTALLGGRSGGTLYRIELR